MLQVWSSPSLGYGCPLPAQMPACEFYGFYTLNPSYLQTYRHELSSAQLSPAHRRCDPFQECAPYPHLFFFVCPFS